jgi:hypothetical protein
MIDEWLASHASEIIAGEFGPDAIKVEPQMKDLPCPNCGSATASVELDGIV